MLKTGTYDPKPINTSEKIQFIIGALILMGFPIPFLIINKQFIPILFIIAGTIIWVIVIQLKVCSDCINFSCVLNRVPEKLRNEFLKRNPEIKKAWEGAGYKIN
jgi:hypothetical protein